MPPNICQPCNTFTPQNISRCWAVTKLVLFLNSIKVKWIAIFHLLHRMHRFEANWVIQLDGIWLTRVHLEDVCMWCVNCILFTCLVFICVLSFGKSYLMNMVLTLQAHTTVIQICSWNALTSTLMKLQVNYLHYVLQLLVNIQCLKLLKWVCAWYLWVF